MLFTQNEDMLPISYSNELLQVYFLFYLFISQFKIDFFVNKVYVIKDFAAHLNKSEFLHKKGIHLINI